MVAVKFIQDKIKGLQRKIGNCQEVIDNNQYNIDEARMIIVSYEQDVRELMKLGMVVSATTSSC